MVRPGRSTQRLGAAYLALQAVLGIGFWVFMATSDRWRAELELLPEHAAVTDSFAVADIAGVVLASALGAWALDAGRPWAVPAVWFAAGGIVYPTLCLVGWQMYSPEGTGGLLLFMMCVVSGLTCWVAVQTWRLFKPRPDPSRPGLPRSGRPVVSAVEAREVPAGDPPTGESTDRSD